ncbi:MAG: T9SS type A sorting domain-containing protein [Bacteroidota bacterium]
MVVETSPNSNLGSGAWPLSAKWRANVNQQGTTDGQQPQSLENHGKSWFPGYAINVNTGERLNIFFGESEWDKQNNGDDMIFNPTSDFGQNLDRVGGRHYVYVTNTRYDEMVSLENILQNADEAGTGGLSNTIFFDRTGNNLADVYKNVAWVGIPLVSSGVDLTSPAQIPTDARISLRVNQPFRNRSGQADIPAFTFNTVELAAQLGVEDVAKDALEKALVVPNPYYAYSAYETGQLDNRIKITNLPQKCRISIFTINGQLVRQFNKDSDEPDQDWDLKNHSGVPVASGVYIVHIDAFDLGEKILKMFAVMRQIDLDSF